MVFGMFAVVLWYYLLLAPPPAYNYLCLSLWMHPFLSTCPSVDIPALDSGVCGLFYPLKIELLALLAHLLPPCLYLLAQAPLPKCP